MSGTSLQAMLAEDLETKELMDRIVNSDATLTIRQQDGLSHNSDSGTGADAELSADSYSATPFSSDYEHAFVDSSPEYGANTATNDYPFDQFSSVATSPEIDPSSSFQTKTVSPSEMLAQSALYIEQSIAAEHFGIDESGRPKYSVVATLTPQHGQSTVLAQYGPDILPPVNFVAGVTDLERQFYDKVDSIRSKPTGKKYPGRHRDLAARFPAARKPLAKKCEEWKKSPDATTQIKATLSLTPTLQTVSKRKGEFKCCKCHGKLSINGNNDGEHCTRCFKAVNREIEYQNGVLIARAEEDLDQPATVFKKEATPYSQSGLAMAPVNTPAFAPLSPMATPIPNLDNQYHVTASKRSKPAKISFKQNSFADNDEEEEAEEVDSEAETEICNAFPMTTLSFGTINEARDYLFNPPQEVCQPLSLAYDDWQYVKHTEFNNLCIELLNVLPVPGTYPPGLDKKDRKRYKDGAAKQLNRVRLHLKTSEQIFQVQARVMLLFNEVVRIHKVGIPKYVSNKSRPRTNCGYEPETNLTCSARARKVIEQARISDYVCASIVKGGWTDLEHLAQAPVHFLEKKTKNFSSNGRRREPATSTASKKKEAAGVSKTNQTPVTGVPNFIDVYAQPSNDYQSYAGYESGGPVYGTDLLTPQTPYDFFSNSTFATVGAGDVRKRGFGFDDDVTEQGSKRARLEDLNEDGEGDWFP